MDFLQFLMYSHGKSLAVVVLASAAA